MEAAEWLAIHGWWHCLTRPVDLGYVGPYQL